MAWVLPTTKWQVLPRPDWSSRNMGVPLLALVVASLGPLDPPARTDCIVDVRAETVRCAKAGWRPHDRAGPPRDQDLIEIVAQGITRDPAAGTVTVSLAVQNRRPFAIGTPDGAARTGLKVYLESGPTVTRPRGMPGSALVLANASGVIDVRSTGDQGYMAYDTILAPGETTAAAPWRWTVPPEVQSFSFSVRVVGANPATVAAASGGGSLPGLVRCEARFEDMCVPDVLDIVFRPGATADERQAAVDYRRATLIWESGDRARVLVPARGSIKRLLEYEFSFRLLAEVAEANHIRNMSLQMLSTPRE
ncbi:MAG TPA: hypothetical protein VF665_11130 [Longimicrobium sp.]